MYKPVDQLGADATCTIQEDENRQRTGYPTPLHLLSEFLGGGLISSSFIMLP